MHSQISKTDIDAAQLHAHAGWKDKCIRTCIILNVHNLWQNY